jgi:hypothetical protein
MMHRHDGAASGNRHHRDDAPPPRPNRSREANFVLRLLAIVIALASAVLVASSACTFRSGVVFHIAGNITVVILEAAALYLEFKLVLAAATAAAAAPADEEENTVATDPEKEQGIGATGIILLMLDLVVLDLLWSVTGSTFVEAKVSRAEIGACPLFPRHMLIVKFLSLGNSAAFTLLLIVKGVAAPVQRAARRS